MSKSGSVTLRVSCHNGEAPDELIKSESKMPFFKSMPANAGPGNVFSAYPEIYRHWAEMGQALINGPSPLSPAEREMIQAYVAGLLGCRYAHVAHTACAVARGIEDGLVAKLLDDIATAPIADKWKPLLQFIRKLTLSTTTWIRPMPTPFSRRAGARRPCTMRLR